VKAEADRFAGHGLGVGTGAIAGKPAPTPAAPKWPYCVPEMEAPWESARRLGAALSRREHGDSWQDPKPHC